MIQALARAAYSRRELVILDDVLSGLDSKTEDSLFNNLLGPAGLLHGAGMTIVLASSDGESRYPTANLKKNLIPLLSCFISSSCIIRGQHCHSWR